MVSMNQIAESAAEGFTREDLKSWREQHPLDRLELIEGLIWASERFTEATWRSGVLSRQDGEHDDGGVHHLDHGAENPLAAQEEAAKDHHEDGQHRPELDQQMVTLTVTDLMGEHDGQLVLVEHLQRMKPWDHA